MSGVIILNQGESAVLQNGVTNVAYTLRLYKLDVTAGLTPDEIDALTQASFSEANFTGYAAAVLATAGWTITQGNPTEAVQPEKQFTCSGGAAQDIWGYYVTRNSDGMAIWFEPFDGPVTIAPSDRIDVVAAVTLDDTRGNDMSAGIITAFGGATAPAGWLLCNGAAVSRTTYADLFAAIGTAYGAGDLSTTFNVPDYRQRFVMGKATAGTGAALGDVGGTVDHVHSLDTATAHARITMPTGSPSRVRMHRVSTTSWNENIVTDDINIVGSGSAMTAGAKLNGSTSGTNPPFGTANFIIKT